MARGLLPSLGLSGRGVCRSRCSLSLAIARQLPPAISHRTPPPAPRYLRRLPHSPRGSAARSPPPPSAPPGSTILVLTTAHLTGTKHLKAWDVS
eukprot:3934538-Rhodomonas_salina.1